MLLRQLPGVFEQAVLLCGAHAGFRLPGEALGLHWDAVDFQAGVIRPYDNWVRSAIDPTKTSDSQAIPRTPRLTRALTQLRRRAHATADHDFVFASELAPERPVSEPPLREALQAAQRRAGLEPIKMYNLGHSFGTALASNGMHVRTIQALMRHDRLSTTEQYMAYAPRPDLASQITRALDPHSLVEPALPSGPVSGAAPTFLARLEEEIPAKWMREVQRLYAEAAR